LIRLCADEGNPDGWSLWHFDLPIPDLLDHANARVTVSARSLASRDWELLDRDDTDDLMTRFLPAGLVPAEASASPGGAARILVRPRSSPEWDALLEPKCGWLLQLAPAEESRK
jgi:hypothetical protein